MAENTLQFEWIVTIKENLEVMFVDRPDIFVAGDLLWYPVEGDPKKRTAPDAMVAIGRPKGYRGSYKQWEEGGIPPQVVFEVLSPGNRLPALIQKFKFYERYGVEEYYTYDPDVNDLAGWHRLGNELVEIAEMNGWTSPRLGIRFDCSGPDLHIYGPDGKRFLTFVEVEQQRKALAKERDQAAQERDQAAQERDQAAQELRVERDRAERLAAQLRSLGVEPPP
jgi:Uma2 family endonuclease